MTSLQRVAAVAVAVLALLAVVLIGVRGIQPGAAAPGASGDPEATACPEEVATPGGSPGADPEVLAAFDQIEEEVLAIRGLEAPDIGPPVIIGREQLVVELTELFDAEYPEEERRRDNLALRAMGLLEPGQDVAQLQLDLLGEQVLGFYDDVGKCMVVVSDAGLDAEAKLTYAHEYTHALQDAAFGLDNLQTDAVGEDDRGLARTALIEGDATQTMLQWAFEGGLTMEELSELALTPVPDTSGTPPWMVKTLEFPYTAGYTWVSDIWSEGGYAAVDEAFRNPPDTTEQVIHRDAWESGEAAVAIDVPDLTQLGSGWEEVDSTPVGEASIRINLENFGLAASDASIAGEGWGGDHLVVASGPSETFAMAWVLAWDTPADEQEFADAYAQVVPELGFPARIVRDNGLVLVVHASTEDLVQQVVDITWG